MTLKVGRIEYANCLPLFRALSSMGDCHHNFVDGVPARLNALLSTGEIDLSPSSSILYGFSPDRYLLLPDLSISATGAVRSVLLISEAAIETLNGSVIGLTSESDTSVALLKIILNTFYRFENSYVRSDTLPGSSAAAPRALLLIGDRALRAGCNVAAGYYVYDLGELWHRFTGLPFVYALWLVNRQSTAGREGEVAGFARTLIRAKSISRHNLATYVAGSHLEWYGAENLQSYWQTISYDLGGQEIAGLKHFYACAAELGLINGSPELSFLPTDATD